jgi:hypothetical protein
MSRLQPSFMCTDNDKRPECHSRLCNHHPESELYRPCSSTQIDHISGAEASGGPCLLQARQNVLHTWRDHLLRVQRRLVHLCVSQPIAPRSLVCAVERAGFNETVLIFQGSRMARYVAIVQDPFVW